jgi:hypothetical protein
MNIHASDISTHLDVLNHGNAETSITELMEKTCQMMKNTWANKQHGKGKGGDFQERCHSLAAFQAA